MNIVRNNENSEITFPTLAVYKEKYLKLLNNYLREYEDNNEKTFVELQIEHWKNYGNEFLNKEGHTFNKYKIEKLRASRQLITEFLENKLQTLNLKTIEPEAKGSIYKKKFEVLLNFANGKYYNLKQNGYSNKKIAKIIFNLTEIKEIENYAQYFKCTNTNNPNDKQNKSKSLFQNIELLNEVIKYCEENKITIHNQFQKEYGKINQNKYD